MIYEASLDAWGEKRNGVFVPLHTNDEYQFRKQALDKIMSGNLTVNEILTLQQECVLRQSQSPYSYAQRKS